MEKLRSAAGGNSSLPRGRKNHHVMPGALKTGRRATGGVRGGKEGDQGGSDVARGKIITTPIITRRSGISGCGRKGCGRNRCKKKKKGEEEK